MELKKLTEKDFKKYKTLHYSDTIYGAHKDGKLVGYFHLYYPQNDLNSAYVNMRLLNKTFARSFFGMLNEYMALFPDKQLRGSVADENVEKLLFDVGANIKKLTPKECYLAKQKNIFERIKQ